MNHTATTLPLCIFEEVGFEGLEGITIEGLCKRLSVRFKLKLPLNSKFKSEIWKFVLNAKCLQLYELQEEREPLKIFDRADAADPFFGGSEPDSCPYNLYKYNPISTKDVRGSCEHFDTRKLIQKEDIAEYTVDQVEESYNRTLVIVASQSLRNSLLISPTVPKDIDLSIACYCILERLGRARYNGELAQGKYSLADIGGDPIAFHSQKKKLLRNNLIRCQTFTHTVEGINVAGQLIHLPRFFAQFKPRHVVIMEKIINILKSKPNCIAEYQDVKSSFEENLQRPLSRIFKSPFFHKFVCTDTKVPYRAIYPNATEREWKLPKKDAERSLNVLQLRNPNIDPSQFWNKSDAEDQIENIEESNGFLDDSHAVHDIPLLNQLYKLIESSKELGVSEAEAGAYFGQSKLSGRALIRNLLRTKTIDFYSTSIKRQTVRRYILPKFNNNKEGWNPEITKEPESEEDEIESQDDTFMTEVETSAQNVKFEPNETVLSDNQIEVEVESQEVCQEVDEMAQEDAFEDPFRTETEIHKVMISENIIVKVTEVDEPENALSKKGPIKEFKKVDSNCLSERTKERLKFLQREVKSKVLFDDPSKLLNALKHEEASRGLSDTMCRKTFFRLLSYLCSIKVLRLWRIKFQYQSKHRSLLYVSNRNVDANFSLMQSYIEQAKSRFQLNIFEEEARKERNKSKGSSTKAAHDANPSVQLGQGPKIAAMSHQSYNYGYTPKFIRLRTLHEFLFYLAREHNASEHLDQQEIVSQWIESSPLLFEGVTDVPMVWNAEIGWKMFVPPLVKHNGFNKGWCLLSDCIFRMPLSVFVKVINIAYEIKGLDEYISHPLKKHFLVKDIPIQLQQMLFVRRKYIAALHDLIRRLICIGLVQAGPHRALKDQAFYYMNCFGRLIDTSSSEPGAYYVTDLEYPENLYKFDSLEDVYTYWDDMHRICMSTKLRRRPATGDQTPADKTLPQKFSPYIKAIHPRQADERDLGELPGDQRGAAGLDSYFFAHLERNWAFNPTKLKPKPQMKMKSEVGPSRLNRLVRITRDANLKKQEARITTVPLHKLKSAAIRRRVSIVRKKTVVVKKKRFRSKYDDIDRMALQHMNKLRVDWNPQEDNFLLLCKVAQMYLNPNNRLVVPGQLIRDLIHWHCKSLNKTKYACRRRINYITKKLPNSDQINSSVMMCLNEIKGNKSIAKRFGENFIHKLKKVYPDEKDFNRAFQIHFIDLVHTLSCQFYNLTNSFESNTLILPRTLQEFNARFIERNDAVYDFNTIRYDEPKTVDDIKISSIVTLIHSTVCSSYDKTSWSIQLYEIYKDFPDKLLSLAMLKVRSDQMISQNKISSNSIYNKAQNRCLPLSSSGFHLSATYQQQMTTKLSYDIFDESFINLKSILIDVNEHNQAHILNLSHSAICFFISELVHKRRYDISIEMPKRVLLLDPSKRLPDESFDGIYARFHEIFNYIPKIGFEDSPLDEIISNLPNEEEKSAATNDTSTIIKKLESLPSATLHFFCIINHFGTTRPRNQIELTDDGKCPFDCIRNMESPTENIMDQLVAKREVWYRLNIDQFEFEPLPAVVTIDEINIVAVYNFLVLNGSSATVEQRNAHLDMFKQVSDIVDELLLENDKDFMDEDFGAEYDLRSDVKKKLYDGAQINDKIHKFHDFLCVNTCKLSLIPNEILDNSAEETMDLKKTIKKRDDILAKIVQNANWSSELKPNKDFIDLMKEKGLDMTEIHIAIDIQNFIDTQGEMGASAATLLERYEDKAFLQKILDFFNDEKLVMKTGVCEVTYVHSKHIKPWVVNTYHLKRLDREAIEPTTKSLLQVSDEPSTSTVEKRKANDDNNDVVSAKRAKIDESTSTTEEVQRNTATEHVGSVIMALDENDPEDLQIDESEKLKPQGFSKYTKRFTEATVEHGSEIDSNFIPPSKKTFPLKMAPWLRVNGSINRRVLDKYAGTILMYCIENVGLTLFTLCTRFHYLLPFHVHEIVQYLEEFGCLTKTAIAKRKPVTLFSTYESVSMGPATDLDDFKDIVIEPTIDAVSKMSIFIGNKKYKEDFI